MCIYARVVNEKLHIVKRIFYVPWPQAILRFPLARPPFPRRSDGVGYWLRYTRAYPYRGPDARPGLPRFRSGPGADTCLTTLGID